MAVGSVSGADPEQLDALGKKLERSSAQLRSIAAQSTADAATVAEMSEFYDAVFDGEE